MMAWQCWWGSSRVVTLTSLWRRRTRALPSLSGTLNGLRREIFRYKILATFWSGTNGKFQFKFIVTKLKIYSNFCGFMSSYRYLPSKNEHNSIATTILVSLIVSICVVVKSLTNSAIKRDLMYLILSRVLGAYI